jgi:hypothetical protein
MSTWKDFEGAKGRRGQEGKNSGVAEFGNLGLPKASGLDGSRTRSGEENPEEIYRHRDTENTELRRIINFFRFRSSVISVSLW